MLIGLFERCMKRRGVKESDPYDWEKVDTIGAGAATQSNNLQVQTKNEYIHGNVTQMTVAASNASGTEYVNFFWHIFFYIFHGTFKKQASLLPICYDMLALNAH